MVNRSLVRTPTRLSLPQQGNFGYLRGTVTGSEERAQGLPGSAAVVRYRDSERGASSLHIIRQIPAQAHWHPGWQRGGIKPSPGSGPGRGLAASGTVGDGARAGTFVSEPWLAPSRRCCAQRASEQAPRATTGTGGAWALAFNFEGANHSGPGRKRAAETPIINQRPGCNQVVLSESLVCIKLK